MSTFQKYFDDRAPFQTSRMTHFPLVLGGKDLRFNAEVIQLEWNILFPFGCDQFGMFPRKQPPPSRMEVGFQDVPHMPCKDLSFTQIIESWILMIFTFLAKLKLGFSRISFYLSHLSRGLFQDCLRVGDHCVGTLIRFESKKRGRTPAGLELYEGHLKKINHFRQTSKTSSWY